MIKRVFSGIMLTLLSVSMLTLAFNLQPVKAGIIIVPDDCPTIQEAINNADEGGTIFVRNETYYENVFVNKTVTLIGENRENTIINGSSVGNVLCVVANNVTVSNFTITGSGSGWMACGIYVNSSNNAIFNNIVTENNLGIYFDSAHNSTLSSNVISNQLIGHYMERSDNNTFKRNILTNNGIGFYSTHSDYNVFDENMIVENEGTGILGLYGYFCTFTQNTLINNLVAFWLDPVCNSLIMNNSIANNREVGVRFHGYSYDNVIIGNNITGSKDGLFFHDTSRTTILHNTISKNEKGIAIYGGSSINVWLEIKYNSIINNTIGLWNSEYLQPKCAQVSQNNFINDTVQAENEKQAILQWNVEYPSSGNYWSSYDGKDLYTGCYQNETGSDGIGDTPYLIDENNQDRYPLMAPISVFDAGAWNGILHNVDIISNSTVSRFQLNKTEKTISFNVTGEAGLGFCRVTIPRVIVQDLWQDNYTVLVNGQPVEFRNETDNENTYIFFTYEHSEHEVIIIPEFPSLIILPLLMLATLLAVIVYRRKHIIH